MRSRRNHSIVVERKVIRADGQARAGDENQVIAFYSENEGVMDDVLSSGGRMAMADGTGVTPLANHVRPAQVTDAYREMIERKRWEADKERDR